MQIEKFEGGAYGTIGYLVADGTDAAAIDVPEHTAKLIENSLKANALKLSSIILTHVHWDHAADAAKLARHAGAKIMMHILDDENQAEINSVFEGESSVVGADRHVRDKEDIRIGAAVLEVIHTPGHTPGSICLYNRKDKILFSGDTLFAGTYGRIDFPLGNHEDMRRSLERLAKLHYTTFVYPGHGPHTTIGNEKWLRE